MKRYEKYADKTDDELLDLSQEERCVLCNKYCNKNLSPTNPACEGKWCDEALDYWLDEEVSE